MRVCPDQCLGVPEHRHATTHRLAGDMKQCSYSFREIALDLLPHSLGKCFRLRCRGSRYTLIGPLATMRSPAKDETHPPV